ncbi:hypothetical protein [Breoghania sp.]|uniref:hypothetical protein n=1 Tax=Breoghania sp. TaxID=2065378 RepID=UPI002AA774B1|nr:hypothetical protein [Breoghania sp.]
MLERDELDGPVRAGILTSAQADRLISYYEREGDPLADREEVRFARSFHDVFITIGIVILFTGLFVAFGTLMPEGSRQNLPTFATAAVVAWGLAEWLARRRKLALPAIVLSILFTVFAALGVMALYGVLAGVPGFTNRLDFLFFGSWEAQQSGPLVFGLAAFGAGALYYWRFQVPIALSGLVAGGLAAAGAALEIASPGLVSEHPAAFMLLAGVVSFALAMRFDAHDLDRTTLNTDKAFWLHLLAAPLIMHSAMMMVGSDTGSTGEAFVIIGVVLALGVVALVVDRRALLVSGLVYLGIALAQLFGNANVQADSGLAVVLLILGLFVLTLGSGWTSVRRTMLAPFVDSGLFDFVPPIRTLEK